MSKTAVVNLAVQPELHLMSDRRTGGLERWREPRREGRRRSAPGLGFSFERKVQVWLRGEIRLVSVLSPSAERSGNPEKAWFPGEFTLGDERMSCIAVE